MRGFWGPGQIFAPTADGTMAGAHQGFEAFVILGAMTGLGCVVALIFPRCFSIPEFGRNARTHLAQVNCVILPVALAFFGLLLYDSILRRFFDLGLIIFSLVSIGCVVGMHLSLVGRAEARTLRHYKATMPFVCFVSSVYYILNLMIAGDRTTEEFSAAGMVYWLLVAIFVRRTAKYYDVSVFDDGQDPYRVNGEGDEGTQTVEMSIPVPVVQRDDIQVDHSLLAPPPDTESHAPAPATASA